MSRKSTSRRKARRARAEEWERTRKDRGVTRYRTPEDIATLTFARGQHRLGLVFPGKPIPLDPSRDFQQQAAELAQLAAMDVDATTH